MGRKIIRGSLLASFVSIILCLLFLTGFFKSWQSKLADNLYTNTSPNSNIVIIAIDDKSIQKIGRFPWDRAVYASLLNKLSIPETKPLSIGIDISFPEPSSNVSDTTLSKSFEKIGNVTLAAEKNQEILLPIPIFQKVTQYGFVNTIADSDTIVRSVNIDDSFALKIAKRTNININQSGIKKIRFIGANNSFPRYSFNDVLAGTIDASIFKDKILLIGATAQDLHDEEITPTSHGTPISGVEIQANIIQNILNNTFLSEESNRKTILTIFLTSFFLSVFLILTPIWMSVIVATFSMFLFWFYAFKSFDQGVIVNLIYPTLAILVCTLANIFYKYFSENRQKRFIKKAFSFYLSKSVLDELLEHPNKLKLGGEKKKITILFSDIANFTTISEKLPAETLVNLLNSYLTEMTNIVFKYNGVLDKYIGDAIMAFWGSPVEDSNQALNASNCALEMIRKVEEIKSVWGEKGVDLDIRIGIHTGTAIVGNMGANQRFDYTIIGDNVNLASRLESLNKEYKTKILISGNTQDEIKDKLMTRKIDKVAVKGKSNGIYIHELVSHAYDAEYLSDFEKARLYYEEQNFSKSRQLLNSLSKKYPGDYIVLLYLNRIQTLSKEKRDKKNEEWDGVFRPNKK